MLLPLSTIYEVHNIYTHPAVTMVNVTAGRSCLRGVPHKTTGGKWGAAQQENSSYLYSIYYLGFSDYYVDRSGGLGIISPPPPVLDKQSVSCLYDRRLSLACASALKHHLLRPPRPLLPLMGAGQTCCSLFAASKWRILKKWNIYNKYLLLLLLLLLHYYYYYYTTTTNNNSTTN